METYQRTQPHLNVGTIGHLGHGKTTLTAAIATVMARKFGGQPVTIAQLDALAAQRNEMDDEDAVVVINDTSRVEYRSSARHYAHIDCPGAVDHVGAMISGASQMDAAILVVSASEGVLAQTREHVISARQQGVTNFIPFINKCDLGVDKETLAQVESAIRALLSEYGYPGNGPVVRGSALGALQGNVGWEASIVELVNALDSTVSVPERYTTAPFLMAIDKALVIDGVTAVTGRIEAGTVKLGDIIDLVGSTPGKTTCKGVRMFDKLLDQGQAGDSVTVLLRGIRCDDTLHGQVLGKTDATRPHTLFTAGVYVLTPQEGGRSEAFSGGYSARLHFRTTTVTGTVELPEGATMVRPGDNIELQIRLDAPVMMSQGQRFSLREGGVTVGVGVVAKVVI
jgi:elongation factor Tu